VAALLVSVGVRGQAAADRLRATATDLGAPGNDAQFGAGLVNARAAVAGLGGGAQGGGTQGGTVPGLGPFLRIKRRHGARAVRRRGIRMRIRAIQAGRATVRVTSRGRLVARGSRRVRAGRTATLVARLTARGKRVRKFRARVRVRLPGERRTRVRAIRVR